MNTGLDFKLQRTPSETLAQEEKGVASMGYKPKHVKLWSDGLSDFEVIENLEEDPCEMFKLKCLDDEFCQEKEAIEKEENSEFKDAEYIVKTKKRWQHIFKFAENHKTVFKKECDDYYKKHPKKFKEDMKQSGKETFIFIAITCVLMGLGFFIVENMNSLWRLIGAVSIAASFISLLLSIVGLSFWLPMKINGAEKTKLSPQDFLIMFQRNKNLKELWYKKEFDGVKNDILENKMYGKKFKKRAEILEEINAYCETRKWLQQWSRGDIKNLHWVEWQALKGISRKYKKFLTPVDEDLKEVGVSD